MKSVYKQLSIKDKTICYQFEEAQIYEGIKRCIENVENLLNTSQEILKLKGNESYSLGLYTFAVEEFGKAQLLWECHTSGKYSITEKEFKNHRKKFKKGFKNLPNDCKEVLSGIRIQIGSPVAKRIHYLKNREVSIGAWLTGNFFDITNKLPFPDFDLRMEIFYVSWDIEHKQWTSFIIPEPQSLLRAIKLLKEFTKNFEKQAKDSLGKSENA